MASTTNEIVWLCQLLVDMSIYLSCSTLMYCDNKSVIQIVHSFVFHKRTKDIEIDCHFTCHHLQHDTLTLPFVPSSQQIVDLFTKPHPPLHFCFWLANSPYYLQPHCELVGHVIVNYLFSYYIRIILLRLEIFSFLLGIKVSYFISFYQAYLNSNGVVPIFKRVFIIRNPLFSFLPLSLNLFGFHKRNLQKEIVRWNTKDKISWLDSKSEKFLVKAFFSFLGLYRRGQLSV